MKRDYLKLVSDIGCKPSSCISYSQLKRIMELFDYEAYNTINEQYFGSKVSKEGLEWQAVDGKELRGTIDRALGQKRNENIVQQVSHQEQKSKLIGFYDGSKESEKTLVFDYFEEAKSLKGSAYSFDALHTSSKFLDLIEDKQGVYLAQVKRNQQILLEELQHIEQYLKPHYTFNQEEKGHGRIERRQGFLYPLNPECLAKRWLKTGVKTLVLIERNRQRCKTGHISHEKAYFITNLKLDENSAQDLVHAVRNHWAIESDNNTRDTNFGEDQIIGFDSNTARVMAVGISWALNLLRKNNVNNNIRELREDIAYDRGKLYAILAA